MALANQVLDFVDDIDKAVLRKTAAAVPDAFASAQILTAEDREKLADPDFALVVHTKEAQTLRKFPVTDAANTWLSCQYFDSTHEALPHVAQKIAAANLNRACAVFGVKPSAAVEKLASAEQLGNTYREISAQPQVTKVASVDIKPDGSKHFYALGDRYPMPSPEYTKKASDYFATHCRQFVDAEDRHVFAENVRARAKELNVDLGDTSHLEKYAGETYGDGVVPQLRMRAELVHDDKLKASLDKLASARGATEPKVFASALHAFDKKANLTRYYDGYIADAYKATFGTFQKVAKGYHWSDDTSGLSMTSTDLEQLTTTKLSKVASYFGQTFADNLKKLPVEIFDSSPQDAKEVLAKIAKGQL